MPVAGDPQGSGLIYFFVFQGHTAFMPLRYLYPECLYLIERHTRVEPLQCFVRPCPANQNCAEALARRVNYLFTEVMPRVQQLFVYFNYRNEQYYTKYGEHLGKGKFQRDERNVKSLGAALFHRDLREPNWLKINRWGFEKCQREGVTLQWKPTTEFLTMGGTGDLIPVESLLRS